MGLVYGKVTECRGRLLGDKEHFYEIIDRGYMAVYISPNSLKCSSRMSNFIGHKLYVQKLINKNIPFASKDKVILNKKKRTR